MTIKTLITSRSEDKVRELKKAGHPYLRKAITFSHTFKTTSKHLFPLLCPTAEFDWMDGWHCEMIYSNTFYAESNAVFKTDFFGFPETWIVTAYTPDTAIEFVRVSEHLSIRIEVAIEDNPKGSCTGIWTIYVTALTETGNDIVQSINPEEDPVSILIEALDFFIRNNRIKTLPDDIFNKTSDNHI